MVTYPETHHDLLQSKVAMLVTIGRNGYPQVTAIWFLFDDDEMIRLSLNTARQKVKNLQAHPECALFFIDPATPWRTLEVRARAELSPDLDYIFADKLGRKYGADVRKMDRLGESRVVVTLHPVKINALDLSQR